MSAWEGLDRRKFPRINYPCLIVIYNSENAPETILTHTENIGVGGICVILKQNIEIFSSVKLEIDLLDMGEHLQCQGKVIWNVQRKRKSNEKSLFYDIGIEFEGIANKDRQRLETVIRRVVKEQDESSVE